jgi:exonuclease SbcD
MAVPGGDTLGLHRQQTVKILHTSDWHLGQTLHGVSRRFEHSRFLEWLLDSLEREQADALLIAGDIFDAGNPPPTAQRAYYEFLSACRQRIPDLDIVVVGGNHDSPARLNAPAALLESVGVRVVGDLPRTADGGIDLDRALVPLRAADGAIACWVVALPFLRPADLPRLEDPASALVAGVRAVYGALFEAARQRREPGQAIVATGHCYMVGGEVSELSERRIQIGNQEALPADLFPDDVAYVALGHLHRAQRVGGRENVRYCGSPLPLSLAERGYRHEVRLVELDGERFVAARSIPVPRWVQVLTVPDEHLPLDEVIPLLEALPREAPDGAGEAERPYLEVRILLETVHPRVRQDVEAAIDGAWARLMRIDSRYTGTGETLGDVIEREGLKELRPEDVFLRCYQQKYDAEISSDVLEAFRELLEQVYSGESP